MPTPKHSVVVETIIWHLNCTNSQATSMQDSLKPEPCTTYQPPTNIRTGVVLQRESNINYAIKTLDDLLPSLSVPILY